MIGNWRDEDTVKWGRWLGSEAVDQDSNEIPAAQALLSARICRLAMQRLK